MALALWVYTMLSTQLMHHDTWTAQSPNYQDSKTAQIAFERLQGHWITKAERLHKI